MQDRSLCLSEVWNTLAGIRCVFASQDGLPWVPDGEYRVNDDDGRLRVIITFSAGVVHGFYTDYWSNGQIASVGHFENGYRHGVWQHYDQDGRLREAIHFVRGQEVVDWDSFFTGRG